MINWTLINGRTSGDWTLTKKLVWLKATVLAAAGAAWATVSGAIASFVTVRAAPIKELVVNVDPVQAGSGDPSPDNIRNISGWPGATIYRTGKNILSPTIYSGGTYNPTVGNTFNLSISGDQFTPNSDNSIFTINAPGSWKYYTLLFPVKNGITYYVSMGVSSSTSLGTSRGYLDKDFKVLSKTNSTSLSQTMAFSITPNADAYYYIVISNRGDAETITVTNPQAEISASASTYEPYAGTTYSISWQTEAGTVYGGTLTVNEDGSGVLTRTYLFSASLNGSGWSRTQINGNYYFTKSHNSWSLANEIVACSHFKPIPTAGLLGNNPDCSIQLAIDRYYQINIRYDAITTADAFKTFMENAGAQMVYTSAAPSTYTLTPGQVTARLGQNYVWADTGDVSVTYRSN